MVESNKHLLGNKLFKTVKTPFRFTTILEMLNLHLNTYFRLIIKLFEKNLKIYEDLKQSKWKMIKKTLIKRENIRL